mmetsp:Transcript_24248/g.50036  ORF Transcript_24248/g.50036 Transcript_24248/m.50036 type:complete len:293 (-) Transcript_24248:438-1316(-)
MACIMINTIILLGTNPRTIGCGSAFLPHTNMHRSMTVHVGRAVSSFAHPRPARTGTCRVSIDRPFALAAAAARLQRLQPNYSRLFGSRHDVPGNPPGEINIYNDQTALDTIDVDRIERTMSAIRDMVGYPTYDVSLLLVDDEEMRQTNLDARGIDGPTDILSFPFQDVAELGKPGVLAEPEFDIPDYYSLGDMMLDVNYVIRRCREDQGSDDGVAAVEGGENDAEADYVDDDRGVSGAMSTVYDAEERIHMLLVHGMLYLVGYDHIEDDEYELMVTKEEQVLQLLRDKGHIK